jgi:hypothetical protein
VRSPCAVLGRAVVSAFLVAGFLSSVVTLRVLRGSLALQVQVTMPPIRKAGWIVTRGAGRISRRFAPMYRPEAPKGSAALNEPGDHAARQPLPGDHATAIADGHIFHGACPAAGWEGAGEYRRSVASRFHGPGGDRRSEGVLIIAISASQPLLYSARPSARLNLARTGTLAPPNIEAYITRLGGAVGIALV